MAENGEMMMDSMSAEVLKLFAFIGITTLAGFTGIIFWFFVDWGKERLRVIKINRMIKHRFDGKPIAKCWCRDCRGYNNKTRLCSVNNVYKADNGFCDGADPVWKRMEEKSNE